MVLPPEVRLVAFANDVAVVVTAKMGQQLENLLNPTLEKIR